MFNIVTIIGVEQLHYVTKILRKDSSSLYNSDVWSIVDIRCLSPVVEMAKSMVGYGNLQK